MKTIVTLLGILFFTTTFSQQNSMKNDIIMTADGQLLQVKVVKVTEEAVSFNYPGESVVNEIRPTKINKIVFASGRTQNFGGSSNTAPEKSANSAAVSEELVPEQEFIPETPSYEEGLLAVVPIDFQRNGAYDKNLASAATKYIIGLMTNKASSKGIQVQQMGTAIEKLIDSDFNYSKLKKATPEQLRGALGAEYLMYVTINENEKKAAATTDLISETSENGTQVERNVNIRLYGANDDIESFEVDFSENVFVNTNTDGSSLLADGKWKSSLRYLTEQLYASRALVD